MKNKKIKCDIYTRVSTTMQVDGYSLDAQKEKLKRYAEFQNMEIVNEYSDEGKSGKSVEGRPEFQRMLDNIENGTDEVQFVLVFKLSRFGRNAADVLNSLQRMQDFGVNLICVEDGIDSSKDSGKLMISVLSAVAEIERENILVQTMEGHKCTFRCNIEQSQIDADSIYGFLNAFNELYAEYTDAEKKQFMQAFIELIDIFPERREDGNWIRNIKFQFPVPVLRDGKEVVRVDGISLDKEQSDEHTVTLEKFPTLETVCLLSRV